MCTPLQIIVEKYGIIMDAVLIYGYSDVVRVPGYPRTVLRWDVALRYKNRILNTKFEYYDTNITAYTVIADMAIDATIEDEDDREHRNKMRRQLNDFLGRYLAKKVMDAAYYE